LASPRPRYGLAVPIWYGPYLSLLSRANPRYGLAVQGGAAWPYQGWFVLFPLLGHLKLARDAEKKHECMSNCS